MLCPFPDAPSCTPPLRDSGTIEDTAGNALGTYATLQWVKVRIRYERPNISQVRVCYWIDDAPKGSVTLGAISGEEQMTNLELNAQEGSAWFDGVQAAK